MKQNNIFYVLDRLAFYLNCLAWLSLASFTILFNYEVFSRYFFFKPSVWGQDVISILVCSVIFLCFPYITRHDKHIVIDVFTNMLSDNAKRYLYMFSSILVAIVLALVGYFAGVEAYKQFLKGTLTASALAIPKWPIMAGISLSFTSAFLYQLLNAFIGSRKDD